MAGLLFGFVINESIHRNFDKMVVFRFHLYYVNLLLLSPYSTMLQNIQFDRVAGFDVINYISALVELRRFGYKL